MTKIVTLLSLLVLLSGCALKHYPSSPSVSEVQKTTLDCPTVQKEIASQQQVQQQIDKTGEFSGLTVLGFIGDFGIGNGVAKSLAQKHADQRMIQLKQLEKTKCSATLPG
ncbi:hypothetical protein QZH36_01475 [Erwinia sp. BC051422]|uniref:hypothetical protein n=1 Tax=Erwinia wuhanensis TaxID=3045167 RepID=UPI002652A019|nr:hypothetical protein [Erwinia sp. BC051422]MDN8540125.1 hypothetical protein [Erwinia sp. BC051422]